MPISNTMIGPPPRAARFFGYAGSYYEFDHFEDDADRAFKLAPRQKGTPALRVSHVTGAEAIHPGGPLRLAALFGRK